MKYVLFNEKQKIKSNFILSKPNAKLSSLDKHERKELAIVWCYYSGKIEGNTYSYVETECLLKDGITAIKAYENAKKLIQLFYNYT